MSTADGTRERWLTTGRRVFSGTLGHEALGVRPRRTRIALGSLACLFGLVLASYAGSGVTVGGDPLETYTWGFDALSMVVIALAAATVTVAPFAYAAWNGGPVFSFALPLAPIAVSDVLAGRIALEIDAAIAVTVGVASAALAVYAAEVRESGSYVPWRGRPPAAWEDRLLFVTAATMVALVAVGSFLETAPAYVLTWYAPFAPLWLVALGLVCTYWGTWLWRSRAREGGAERGVANDPQSAR